MGGEPLMKFLNWLAALVPPKYSIGIAIKKVSIIVGKLAGSYVFAKLVTKGHITAEMATQYQLVIATGVVAGLEYIHDFFKLKYPHVSWL